MQNADNQQTIQPINDTILPGFALFSKRVQNAIKD